MTLNLTKDEISVLLAALNDREGVLSADYETACSVNSRALADKLRADLKELRRIADVLVAASKQAA